MINNLPTNLRKLRDSKKMSCRELSEDIEAKMDVVIFHGSLNQYENRGAQPNINTLIILADYFEVTIDRLVR